MLTLLGVLVKLVTTLTKLDVTMGMYGKIIEDLQLTDTKQNDILSECCTRLSDHDVRLNILEYKKDAGKTI